MTAFYTITNGEEFYLELIAKELRGEISDQEKATLLQWMTKKKEQNQLRKSPLLGLYAGIVSGTVH